MSRTFYFDPADRRIKSEGEWKRLAGGRYRAEYALRKHAVQHGLAGMWSADGSLLVLYKDGGALRARRWPSAEPRHDPTKRR